MPSVQRFFSGRNNLARNALLAASSVRASTAVERTAVARAGGGRVRLVGSYVGHEATDIDVRIDAAGGTPRASVPQFVGVGNGTLQVLGVGAAAPLQSLTFTLADLGVQTTHAGLDVREARLVAKAAGSAGNAISVTVEPLLTRTPTAWALLADWATGQDVQTGPQWDFGGLPLSPKDELDAASPRIAFGFDPEVYRPWRRFRNGQWEFGLSPALQRAVAKGTPVHAVTGGYKVTITDGVTTEVYGDTAALPVPQPAVVTFYDLLTQLAASALVDVAGVVAADRTVGGQAAIDVPLRTSAWLLALGGAAKLADVGVPPAAPTQTVTVRCINADTVGAERWAVTGDVSGALAPAITGVPYTHAAIAFTVPALDPAAVGSGETGWRFSPASRSDAEGVPSVCLKPLRLGVNARPTAVTFEYRKRPPADCNCAPLAPLRIRDACLGIGGEADMALDPAHQSRLEDLFEWRRDFFGDNTAPGWPMRWAKNDLDLADAVVKIFSDALAEVHPSSAARTEWDAALTDLQAEMASLVGLVGSHAVPASWRVRLGERWRHVGRLCEVTQIKRDGTTVTGIDFFVSPLMADVTPVPLDAAWQVAVGADVTLTVDWSTYTGSPESGAEWTVTLTRLADPVAAVPEGADIDGVPATVLAELMQTMPRRYSARMDYCRALAGIVPKSDPSTTDAGGCWVDHGGTHWWVDQDGLYLPAFTNQPYVSARRNADTGEIKSTMEFGFGLVVACPERLKIGDSITVRIITVDGERPYKVGDEAIIQTIGAGPAWLAGGVDGTDVQTWAVQGSASGVLPSYVLPTDGAPAPTWSHAGIDVEMAMGGIGFALGDRFGLAVEAGQYQWRRDGGAWSAVADIPASGPALLADGLELHFDAGAAPSFVPGDSCGFHVHQPHAASHVKDAQATAWAWAGAGATMLLDLGSVQPIAALALARYSLPAGATVSVELSADGATWGAPVALDVSRTVAVAFTAGSARYLRLTVAAAMGGHIGWVWAGVPFATDHHASKCERRRRWAVQRGGGYNAASLYAGAGDGWRLAWAPGDWAASRLLEADVAGLLPLLDWAQQQDEPLLFVPHHLHPQDAALVRFAADALEVADLHEWQSDDAGARLLSASLELEPVFA